MNQHPLITGVNDLATTHPALSKEWDHNKNESVTPGDVSHGSVKKAWWRCEKGHSWQAAIYSRTGGTGCPYCANIKVLPGFNDLPTLNPELVKEWDYEKNAGIRPEMVAPNSSKKLWWKCGKGHSWQAVTASRNTGRGCPYCTNRTLLPGFNDLATVYPLLAAEWHTEKNGRAAPGQILAGGHKKRWWLCSLGHEWQATVSNRIFGSGCPYCAGRTVFPGFNDLATTRPDILEEWDYGANADISPTEVSRGSRQSVWWRCKNGHSFKSLIVNRTNRGTGCPYCQGRKPLAGVNDFAAMFPELLKEWDYEKNTSFDPSKTTYQARKAVWWKCSKNHSWKAEIYERVHGGGCPFCNRKKDKHRVVSGVNDLMTVNPNLAAEWDEIRNGELTAADVLPCSNRTVWWKCSNGHHWRTSPNARHRGTKCPYCGGKIPKKTRLI